MNLIILTSILFQIRLSSATRLISTLFSKKSFSSLESGQKFLDSAQQDKQDIRNVERLEDQLFGRYYGATDSSNINAKKPRKEFRRRPINPRPPRDDRHPSPLNNPWNITTLRLHDSTLSKLILDARMPKRLKKQQKMIVEGKRLIKDAILAGLRPHAMVISDPSLLADLEEYRESHFHNCSFYRVPIKDLSTWSSLTTCPGILAIFERPKEVQSDENCLPITVVCDNIREPSNLGSIFRVAAALPCRRVVVIKGCADPWESKCLRGGSGGQFHIPIEYPVTWEELHNVIKVERSEIFLAENESKNDLLKVQTIDDQLVNSPDKDIVVVIGGETHGISDEAYE